jgi:hypothetical protein
MKATKDSKKKSIKQQHKLLNSNDDNQQLEMKLKATKNYKKESNDNILAK